MKQIRVLAQYYVDLMVKLGLVRFFAATGIGIGVIGDGCSNGRHLRLARLC